MSVLHVRFDGGHVLASVAADAADDGRVAAVHLIHVLLQVVLDFELFLADCTRVLEAAGVLSYEVIFQGTLVVALVLADTARIEKRSVDLLHVVLQVPLQAEALAAGLALVLVLAHVLYHSSLLAESFAARGAFQEKLRLLPLDLVLNEILSSRDFLRMMILLVRYADQLFFFRNMTFLFIGQGGVLRCTFYVFN